MAISSSILGISYSEDVKLLQGIYVDLLVEERIRNGDFTAEELITATLDLFSAGVFDREEIRDGLSRFLVDRSH